MTGALALVVILALVSMRGVGKRAALTVDRVTELLERNEARFRAMVRDSSDIMAIVDPDGMLVYASPATERLLGLEVEPLLGTSLFALIHPDDLERALHGFELTRSGKENERVELRLRHADGGWRLMEAVATNLLDDPTVGGIVISARDLTERRRAEAELREAQERFRSAFEHAPIGMALVTLDGRVFRVNRALVQIVGRTEDNLLRSSLLDLLHPDDVERCRRAMSRLLAGEIPSVQLEQRFAHRDVDPVWVSTSTSLVRNLRDEPLYFVNQIEDISARKASREALAHQAAHDPLTGLPNRARFVQLLSKELGDARDDDRRLAVLFLDLDRFKVVNDSLGHSAGDRLLVAAADRIRSVLADGDVVSRFGGDEFTVMCPLVSAEETAEHVAERIREAIARPVALVEGEVFVSASIGIALSGHTDDSPETLLRNADAAMYRAKELGRSQSQLFDPNTHHRVVDSLRIGNALHRAIERREMRLFYQPVVSLDDGRLIGFEALIRWEHPERGLVSPMEFIPLAEETGLIVPLGAWALEEACRQLACWHASSPRGARLTMSVNLSPRQLVEQSLPNDMARVLLESGVPAESLWLEITETTLMSDAEAAVSALDALRALGVHLAVDDFGSGYSSLAYLERLPIESLKVDRAFVSGVGVRPDSTTIASAIVSLARALGLTTVGEGVETATQLRGLQGLQCDLAQGYLFGPPRPPHLYGDDPTATLGAWGQPATQPVEPMRLREHAARADISLPS